MTDLVREYCVEVKQDPDAEIVAPQPGLCSCNNVPLEFVSEKEGPNKGRKFRVCSQAYKNPLESCTYFRWLPKPDVEAQRRKIAEEIAGAVLLVSEIPDAV